MKATKKEAISAIRWRDLDSVVFPPARNDKRRNCVFCGKNIKGGEQYFKHFEYSYEANQKRWNACVECFNRIYEKFRPLNPLCRIGEIKHLDK